MFWFLTWSKINHLSHIIVHPEETLRGWRDSKIQGLNSHRSRSSAVERTRGDIIGALIHSPSGNHEASVTPEVNVWSALKEGDTSPGAKWLPTESTLHVGHTAPAPVTTPPLAMITSCNCHLLYLQSLSFFCYCFQNHNCHCFWSLCSHWLFFLLKFHRSISPRRMWFLLSEVQRTGMNEMAARQDHPFR